MIFVNIDDGGGWMLCGFFHILHLAYMQPSYLSLLPYDDQLVRIREYLESFSAILQ